MRLAPLLTLVLLSPALAAQPTGSTVAAGGGPASDVGESVAADVLSGEFAVVGTFEQTATFGAVSVTSADAPATRSDAFAVKYSPDGTVLWARRMGTDVFNDFGAGVALTSNFEAGGESVYVSGYFTGIATFDGGANPTVSLTTRSDFDAFLAKYSPQGDLLWVQQAGGSEQDTGRGVAVDSEGRALWVGSFTGTSTWGSGASAVTRTSAGSSDGFLARYLPDGTLDRLLTVGGDESDGLWSVATSPFFPFSPAYVTGTFRSVAFFGTTPLQSRGLSDVAVVRVGDDNAVEWARQIGGSGNDYARGVAVGRYDNVAVAGSFENTVLVGTDVLTSAGASDAFLAVYDATGAEVGARRGGGAGFDIANGVTATPNIPIVTLGGGSYQPVFVLTGYIDGPGTFDAQPLSPQGLDAFATVYADDFESDGGPSLLDVFLVGGTNSDRGNGAAMGLYGEELLLTGSFRGALTFGGGAVTSAGSNDVFVARLPLCPAYSCLPVAEQGGPDAPAARLSVAPNPSRLPTVTVRLDAPADATVEIVDALGRVHAVLHRGTLAGGETRLSPGPLAPGVYVVRLRGGVEARQSFVVVR